jgi:hypothetical protein
MGYTGDGHVFAKTGAYNFDTERFWAKFLKDMKHTQDGNKEGYVAPTVPAPPGEQGIGFMSMLGWGNCICIIPEMMYYHFGKDSYLREYYGAMKKLYTQNYGRDFAGRGYMIIEVNGEERILYTPFTSENVRSVRYVAQQLQLDTPEYEALSDAKKAVVDTYANSPVYGQENVAATALNENYAAAYVVNEKKAFCKNVKDEKISFATQRKERV